MSPQGYSPSGSRGWCSQLVISDANPARVAWDAWMMVLLVYTGVVFPIKLAFIDFGLPDRTLPDWFEWVEFWTLDVGFGIDLFANFFFSYRDRYDREVFDLYRIVRHYLRGHFAISFIACIPTEMFSWLIGAILGMDSFTTTSINEAGRLSRLARMSRLFRLTRLLKARGMLQSNKVVKEANRYRHVRTTNQCGGLLFVANLMACGWWIVAALHADIEDTWVGRRTITMGQETHSLVQLSYDYQIGVFFQWVTSMYFTLTIFTTVGFGDMSAYTIGEMVYACIAMIVGCIVNGIILSEVISIYAFVHDEDRLMGERQELARRFGQHMQLDRKTAEELAQCMRSFKMEATVYNRDDMRGILMSDMLPRRTLGALPKALFGGKLVLNRFVRGSNVPGTTIEPPRFPILLGLACSSHYFDAGDVVYNTHDPAWNVYLVLRGTFSYVALTGYIKALDFNLRRESEIVTLKAAGIFGSKAPVEDAESSPYQLFGRQQYFGDIELFMKESPRLTTARCESKEGHALVLHKRDLHKLAEEFPHMSNGWRVAASHRSRRRIFAHRQFQPCKYTELAARNLQRSLRYLLRRKQGNAIMMGRQEATAPNSPSATPSLSVVGVESEGGPDYVIRLQAHLREVQAEMRSEMHGVRESVTADIKAVQESLAEIKNLISCPSAGRQYGS